MATSVQFDCENDALKALDRCGFSVGRLQRDQPRGLLVGDFDIQKWRNLTPDDRGALHGMLVRLTHGHGGPVEVTLSRNCPPNASKLLQKWATT